jgi:hypothetical protein
MRARTLVSLTVMLSLCVASSAAAGSTGLRFSSFPDRALPGADVSIAVSDPRPSDQCALRVSYAGGAPQSGLPARAVAGHRVLWSWKVPSNARTGLAHVSVACKSGKLTRPLMVVGALAPPKIDVVKQGFSLKTPKFGGDSVSYGVVLANRSTTDDALDVYVLVNFVNDANVLIGSQSTNVKVIRAGSEYALGQSLAFPAAAPVSRLEIVVQVGSRQPKAGPALVSPANVRIVPSLTDPAWVGSVEGEIANENPELTMGSAALSGVVLDAAGNVVGGGTGSTYGSVPPGARVFVKLTSGFSSVPIAKAASVQFSVEPQFNERK